MKTLIIKLGAMGDVLRTTSVLNHINGDEVTWVTEPDSVPIVTMNQHGVKAVSARDEPAMETVGGSHYDRVWSLDEDSPGPELGAHFLGKVGEFKGFYSGDGGGLCFTPEAECWYKLLPLGANGKPVDVGLKRKNKKPYQQIIHEMLGLPLEDMGYCFYPNIKENGNKPKKIVGLETHVGRKWPNKAYGRMGDVEEALGDVCETIFFRQKKLGEYINDVGSCDVVVTPDTMTMHLALALGIPTVALFGPTSPDEIYDCGGKLTKITGNACMCYNPVCSKDMSHPACMSNIEPASVANAVLRYLSMTSP